MVIEMDLWHTSTWLYPVFPRDPLILRHLGISWLDKLQHGTLQ